MMLLGRRRGRAMSIASSAVIILLLGLIGDGRRLRGVQGMLNGVGKLPVMGWNSWNSLRCEFDEGVLREVADAMVNSGLRDAGYRYLVIDDCWMAKHRNTETGEFVADPKKFPSGMKALSDYVHSLGLKFGIYTAAGDKTCEGYPASLDHEEQDANLFKKHEYRWPIHKSDEVSGTEWEVDLVKHDFCSSKETAQVAYTRMSKALNATGRPIVLNICSWGGGQPSKWGPSVGHSWRTGIDLFAVWDEKEAQRLALPNFFQSVLQAIRQQEKFADAAGPGQYNDPDMLVVGVDGMTPYGIVNTCPEHVKSCTPGKYISREQWGQVGGLTQTEQRAHFAMWCMLAAPLVLGNDPRYMKSETLEILTNQWLIEINQDPLAKQARKISSDGDLEVWKKDLLGSRVAVALWNLGSKEAMISVKFDQAMSNIEVGPRSYRAKKSRTVCEDENSNCRDWAESGECNHNPGFMMSMCKKSCPGACGGSVNKSPSLWAKVFNVWTGKEVGIYFDSFTAIHVEPHEAQVFILIPSHQPEESLDEKRLLDRSGEYYFLDIHRASIKQKSTSSSSSSGTAPVKADKAHPSTSIPAQKSHRQESHQAFLNRADLTVLSICVNAVALTLLGIIWSRHGYTLPLHREKRRIQ